MSYWEATPRAFHYVNTPLCLSFFASLPAPPSEDLRETPGRTQLYFLALSSPGKLPPSPIPRGAFKDGFKRSLMAGWKNVHVRRKASKETLA